MLLDEPFSSLDPALRQDLRTEVFQTLAQAGVSALMVTHDEADVVAASARVGRMESGRLQEL